MFSPITIKLFIFATLLNLSTQSNKLPSPVKQQKPVLRLIYETIVIGSGISGSSAAYKLAQQKKKILVLEANNYNGGRTKSVSVNLADKSVFNFQYGANWIHGSNPNHPITMLANKMGNVKLTFTDDESMVVYDSLKNDVTNQTDAQWTQYQTLLDEIQQTIVETLSANDVIQQQSPQSLTNKYFMFNVGYDVQFETATPINLLSAKQGLSDSKFTGKEMLVTSGYQKFSEYLLKNSFIKVLLNHRVIEITYKNGINTIKCANGAVFASKNVVISVPIGVLKNNGIKFTPPLPSWKTQSINGIQLGNVVKILIVAKKSLTIDNQQHYIGVVSNDITKRGSMTYFLNLKAVANLHALMTFGLGPNADEIQSMKQSDLKVLIAERLKIVLKKPVTTSDFAIYRSSWRSNANFRGAYSYAGLSTKRNHWQNMAKPIFANRWYFCGEHTHDLYRATVHGGYLSGIYSADQIINSDTEADWQYQGS